jgi:hypothetical protein
MDCLVTNGAVKGNFNNPGPRAGRRQSARAPAATLGQRCAGIT